MPSIAEIDLKLARPLHYTFAHYVLRNEALIFSQEFVNALRYQDQGYLKHQWFKAWGVSAISGMRPDKESLPFEEIKLCSVERDGYTCHVIVMPEAKAIGEAILIGVVEVTGQRLRYFTLEKSYSTDGSLCTCFCEWEIREGDYTHLNFGEGPDGTIEAFADRVFLQVNSLVK